MAKLKVFWSVAGLLALGLTIPASLNATGFCWKERRYLSDEQLIHAFADNKAKNLRLPSSRLEAIIASNTDEANPTVSAVVEYKSGDDFLAANPNFCIVGRDVEGVNEPLLNPGWRPRLWGYAHNIVTSTFSIMYFDDSGTEKRFSTKTNDWVDACGRIKSPFL
jgi:hypothetical protein